MQIRPASIIGIYYKTEKDIIHYYFHSKRFFMVPFYDNGIYHMRLLTPSLTDAVRIFKRASVNLSSPKRGNNVGLDF